MCSVRPPTLLFSYLTPVNICHNQEVYTVISYTVITYSFKSTIVFSWGQYKIYDSWVFNTIFDVASLVWDANISINFLIDWLYTAGMTNCWHKHMTILISLINLQDILELSHGFSVQSHSLTHQVRCLKLAQTLLLNWQKWGYPCKIVDGRILSKKLKRQTYLFLQLYSSHFAGSTYQFSFASVAK